MEILRPWKAPFSEDAKEFGNAEGSALVQVPAIGKFRGRHTAEETIVMEYASTPRRSEIRELEHRSKLASVETLRGLAAIAIVSHHALHMLGRIGGYSVPSGLFLGSGVDLFFVISGFIMTWTNWDHLGPAASSRAFLLHRMARILPAYWVCTTGVVVLLLAHPTLFKEQVFDLEHTIASYVLLLSANSTGTVGTVLQTGWTLCFEAYFYLLFAAALRFPRSWLPWAIGGTLLAGTMVGALHPSLPVWTRVATDPIVFEFLLGILLGFFLRRRSRWPVWTAILCLVGGAFTIVATAGMDTGTWMRSLQWGLPAAALLFGAVSLEASGMRFPSFASTLGAASYSVYLVHPFVVPPIGKILVASGQNSSVPAWLAWSITVGLSLVAGIVFHRRFEAPVHRVLRAAIAGSPRGESRFLSGS